MIFVIFNASCRTNRSLVNTAHLEHLYEEMKLDTTVLGAIWIYCEAPDFHKVGDDDEGYTCVDDVARALVFYCREMKNKPSKNNRHKIITLTNFLLHMQAENGYFYNFMFQDGTTNRSHQNSVAISAFWTWRAYWAMTEVLLINDKELKNLQSKCEVCILKVEEKILDKMNAENTNMNFDGIEIPSLVAENGCDQLAEMLKGLVNHYAKNQSKVLKVAIQKVGHQIMASQKGSSDEEPYFAFLSWQNYWHAWGNAQSYALLKASQVVGDETMKMAALNEINHFYRYCIKNNYLSGFKVIRGDDNSFHITEFQTYSQIAYGMSPMILAITEAWKLTQDPEYAEMTYDLASWFFGNNNAHSIMYDIQSGRGLDGINGVDQVNKNSGAESTIEALLTMQALEQLKADKTSYNQFINQYVHSNSKSLKNK